MNIKKCYIDEIEKTASDVLAAGGDFKLAAVTDSHLDNSVEDTLTNISEVDKRVSFDCMVHLGDYLNGNIPPKYTEKIFKEQIELFSSATKCDFYPVQGNHDGYTDYVHNDMATNELWTAATGLEKPYYYIDIPDKKIRLIIICSFHYIFEDGEFFKKYGIEPAQVEWFRNEALDVGEGWTVMLFSHVTPFKKFSDEAVNDESYINGKEVFRSLISARKERGFDIAAWITGDTHGDYIGKVCGVNFVIVGNETAYVPQLWKMPEGGYFAERDLDTVTEDLWDAIVLDKKERLLKLFRFGAGHDREIGY